MNREILFRGKRVDNGEWLYGCLIQTEQGFKKVYMILHWTGLRDNEHTHIVDKETVGQYTGLKDKYGVKIFEGDLLEVCGNKNGYLKVEFLNAYVGGWVLSHTSTDKTLSLGARNSDNLQVVGNIHDKNK